MTPAACLLLGLPLPPPFPEPLVRVQCGWEGVVFEDSGLNCCYHIITCISDWCAWDEYR